uniref:Uncharacterized protein n=1 Tax=Anguilla anguilla TaxID=7936 RepID=A0A0E9VVE1_ANGAN
MLIAKLIKQLTGYFNVPSTRGGSCNYRLG